MDTLYKKIAKTFEDNKSVFTERELPFVQQVDVYMGQPDDPENWEVFTPAVFVNWSLLPTDDKNSSTLHLEFHVVQEPTGSTEGSASNIDLGLQYISVLKTVKYLLNKLRSDNSTPLRYKGEKPAASEFFKYHIVNYECQIDDDDTSFSRTQLTTTTPSDTVLTGANLKQKLHKDDPNPIIDVY